LIAFAARHHGNIVANLHQRTLSCAAPDRDALPPDVIQ